MYNAYENPGLHVVTALSVLIATTEKVQDKEIRTGEGRGWARRRGAASGCCFYSGMLYQRPPSHPSVSHLCGFLRRIHFPVSFGNNGPSFSPMLNQWSVAGWPFGYFTIVVLRLSCRFDAPLNWSPLILLFNQVWEAYYHKTSYKCILQLITFLNRYIVL
jgi:hypothetical protein